MKAHKLPKVVWANRVNLQGLVYGKPVKCRLDRSYGANRWWDSSGNFDVASLGTSFDEGMTTFASTNEKLVQKWTEGAQAVMALLQHISG